MASKLRAKSLNAADIRKESGIDVPEWDITVDVWGMTGAQRAKAIATSRDEDGSMDTGKLAVAVIIATVRDPETGELVYDEGDRDTLLGKSGEVLDRLATIGLRLSGMTPEARETIRKNSETASDGSTSDSPKVSA